jgi:hypothetical protein
MSPLDKIIGLTLVGLALLSLPVWAVMASREARRLRRRPEPIESVPFLGIWECWVTKCDRAAALWVSHPVSGDLFVCTTCAHDGASLGWWTVIGPERRAS